jgi:NADH:ubiquinone oxidoreductase subunit F (NADH-binding)
VQNVESLAHAALIARHGAQAFRAAGAPGFAGTILTTITGAVGAPGVVEVAQGTPIAAAVDAAGGLTAPAQAVLLGGYFGGWVEAGEAWQLPLDSALLRAHGRSLGCGVVGVLPQNACGVVETSRIISYLADQSARQCGPCVFGLRAIADSVSAVAARNARPQDLERLRRWAEQLGGRGACRHPDGAASFLLSGLRAFEAEFALHQQGRCSLRAGRSAGAA